MNKVLGIIPARFESTRLPGKPLVKILGIPMIIRTAQNAANALGHDNIIIATDDLRISHVCDKYGFKSVLTKKSHLTGTDRIWEVAQQYDSDIYINIQGDEPIMPPEDIKVILSEKQRRKDGVINGICQLPDHISPEIDSIPKAVVNEDGKVIYISRLAVPGTLIHKNEIVYQKQVCVYAFSYEELKAFGEFGRKSKLEKIEDIEMLRFFELDINIYMVETSGRSMAVDLPSDVSRVEQFLENNNF
jgi:3-deoxy-manno-octulosonate cytidylyltransferase (CMP-KDO synthetase)